MGERIDVVGAAMGGTPDRIDRVGWLDEVLPETEPLLEDSTLDPLEGDVLFEERPEEEDEGLPIDLYALTRQGSALIGVASVAAMLGALAPSGPYGALLCGAMALPIGAAVARFGLALPALGAWSAALVASDLASSGALTAGTPLDFGLVTLLVGASLAARRAPSGAEPLLIEIARPPAAAGAVHVGAVLAALSAGSLLGVSSPIVALAGATAAGICVVLCGTGSALSRRFAAVAGGLAAVAVLPGGLFVALGVGGLMLGALLVASDGRAV